MSTFSCSHILRCLTCFSLKYKHFNQNILIITKFGIMQDFALSFTQPTHFSRTWIWNRKRRQRWTAWSLFIKIYAVSQFRGGVALSAHLSATYITALSPRMSQFVDSSCGRQTWPKKKKKIRLHLSFLLSPGYPRIQCAISKPNKRKDRGFFFFFYKVSVVWKLSTDRKFVFKCKSSNLADETHAAMRW